jgi:hypothetical protein
MGRRAPGAPRNPITASMRLSVQSLCNPQACVCAATLHCPRWHLLVVVVAAFVQALLVVSEGMQSSGLWATRHQGTMHCLRWARCRALQASVRVQVTHVWGVLFWYSMVGMRPCTEIVIP